MDGPWGVESDDVQFGRVEYPLAFHALYSESRPTDGKVEFSQLQRVLARTGLGETEIDLLCSGSAGAQIEEQKFYEILHAAALIQDPSQDPNHVHLELNDATYTHRQVQLEPENIRLVSEKLLKVDIKPVKGGIWGFKYTVYTVTGQFDNHRVLVARRYSDFTWLLDYLVKQYTFRVLPVLPPKRVQVNGHYLSGDSAQFLDRRKFGLARFLNLVVSHPRLREDPILQAFLLENSPVDTFKLRASVDDELHGVKASQVFIAEFDEKKFNSWLLSLQNSNERALVYATNLGKMMSQHVRRRGAQAANSCNVTMDLEGLRSELSTLYAHNQENINFIGNGVTAMAQHFEQEHKALLQSAQQLQFGALEDIKYYRDVLLSVKELFKRHRIMGGNTILQLKSKIERTRSKIASLQATQQTQLMEKLEHQLVDLQDQVKYQVNRSWLVKQVIVQELQMIQASQFQLSLALRKFGAHKMEADQEAARLSSSLYDKVCDLPLA